MTDKTLSDDHPTILKPCMEETVGNNDLGSVVVTETFVEKTEVSVVEMIEQGEYNEITESVNERIFGNLGDEDEGLKVNSSENGTSMGMDVEGSLAGGSGSFINAIFEDKAGEDRSDINAIFEEKAGENGDMNKNDEENVENGENNGDEEYNWEQAESEDHGFVVGDFVWGKIKSHPWWPGQIYDPNDASDYAVSLKGEGQLLVAYFGDRSFSWCSPSQLNPFIDNFEEMSSQSDSKKFVYAVQSCLEEVSRCVEAELMRKCQTVNVTENAGVVNRGIKKGACAPKGNTVKVLVERIEPVEIVSTLKGYATMEPGARLVELGLAVLKSFLRAFYASKGGFLLVDYCDPMCIEGLEEETRSGVAGSDVNGPMGSPENGDDKLYERRKQKSVAELMGEDESKIKKAKSTKDGDMKEIKRKLVVSVTPEFDHGSGGVEEETMSPRQRKKSRYLSPPYLSPIGSVSGKFSVLGSGTGSGSGSFKEPKTEPEKVKEMAGEKLEDSLKSSGKRAREKRRVGEGSDPQEHKNMDAVVSVAMMLDGLLHAALDVSSCVQKENLPTVMELVLSFRSSNFKEGSSNQTGKKRGSSNPTGKKSSSSTGKKKESSNPTGKKKESSNPTGKKKTFNQTGEKKDGEDRDTSELGFIKQKLEWMSEMVQKCEESEMNADVKANLQGGLQEVIGKVVKMRGK